MALGAPLTLAEELEVDGGKLDLNLQKAQQACAKLLCFVLSKDPEVYPKSATELTLGDLTAGTVEILHLQAKPSSLQAQIKKSDTITHLLDIIRGVEGPIDFEIIEGPMKQGDLAALPEPFRPKGILATSFKMSFAVIPADDAKHDVVMH